MRRKIRSVGEARTRWSSPIRQLKMQRYMRRPSSRFLDHLGKCTGKRVVYFPVQSNAAEIEAMRAGRLHVGGFSTGPTGFAVNLAGAVPFAVKGNDKEWQGYNLIMIVKRRQFLSEALRSEGKKRVAHTSPSSNSGHLAPQVLFPPKDSSRIRITSSIFSGGMDNPSRVSSLETTMQLPSHRTYSTVWRRVARSRPMTSGSFTKVPSSRPRRLRTRHDLQPSS